MQHWTLPTAVVPDVHAPGPGLHPVHPIKEMKWSHVPFTQAAAPSCTKVL